MNWYSNNPHPDTLERFFERVQVRAAAEDPEARRDPRLRDALGQALAHYLSSRRRAIVWHYLKDEGGKSLFEIGHEGERLVQFSTGERCVWWLWAAINDNGETATLRTKDFAAPDVTAPDASARKALRMTAPGIVGRLFPAMKDAIDGLAKCITVENGVIRCSPGPCAPRVITR